MSLRDGFRVQVGRIGELFCVQTCSKPSLSSVRGVCCCFPWLVITTAIIGTAGAIEYTRQHFAIDTNTSQLISSALPWRQRELQLDAAFPQRIDTIVVVVDGLTPELADSSARALAAELAKKPELFQAVRRPDGGPFFDQNGLLFLSTAEIERATEQVIRAQPILGTLAADPTLRGFAGALAFIPMGATAGQMKMDDFVKPLSRIADILEALAANRKVAFSWGELMIGEAPQGRDLRRFIHVKPVLDYGSLEPGAAASEAIRSTVRALHLDPENGVTIRLTGPVPLADEELSTVADGALLNTALTVAAVLLILWLALRSGRIIAAVVASLFVGLAITAAAGLAMVGALNLISVAFAVLFVGIGVDFGIQFAVRYRQERHSNDDLQAALVSAAREAGKPLALAAAATAAGFLAFLPTDYRGVSELGLIAGAGMIIAFLTSITLLPALLTVLKPPGEAADVGYRALAPVDRFLARHRHAILALSGIAVAAGLPLLKDLRFDFNPLNLRSPKVESVATLLDLMKDPATALDTIDILTPSITAAKELAQRLDQLPEVSRTLTLQNFVPDSAGREARQSSPMRRLCSGLHSRRWNRNRFRLMRKRSRPLSETAKAFAEISGKGEGVTALSHRLAAALMALASAETARRSQASSTFAVGLQHRLEQIRQLLKAERVSIDQLPRDLVRDWVTEDGRARVEVAPKGDGHDNETLKRFASAVLAVGARRHGNAHSHPGIGEHGGRGLYLGGRSRAGFDHADSARRAQTRQRCPPDAGAFAARQCGDARADGAAGVTAQLCQHHRAAAAAWRRCRVQDLLCARVARRRDQSARLLADACGFVQRTHHSRRFRELVVLEPPRHVEHGQAAESVADYDARRGRAVSAHPDGAAAPAEVEGRRPLVWWFRSSPVFRGWVGWRTSEPEPH